MPSVTRRFSLDSSRPILVKKVIGNGSSARFSTYSTAVSESPSEMTFHSIKTTDTYGADICDYTTAYERLECKRMQEQRYIISPQKEGDMSKLALVAKVQRALDRRFHGQDAVLRPRTLTEKAIIA